MYTRRFKRATAAAAVAAHTVSSRTAYTQWARTSIHPTKAAAAANINTVVGIHKTDYALRHVFTWNGLSWNDRRIVWYGARVSIRCRRNSTHVWKHARIHFRTVFHSRQFKFEIFLVFVDNDVLWILHDMIYLCRRRRCRRCCWCHSSIVFSSTLLSVRMCRRFKCVRNLIECRS